MTEEVFKPEVGKVYRHFQTGVLFQVDGNGYYMESNEPGVVLTNLIDGQIYVWPARSFLQSCAKAGATQPAPVGNCAAF